MEENHRSLIAHIRLLSVQTPDDQFLRFLLADHLLEFGYLEEAEAEFLTVVEASGHWYSKAGLARIQFLKGKFHQCRSILEELIQAGFNDVNVILLYARTLLRQELPAEACKAYKKVVNLHPLFFDEELNSVKQHCE